MTVRIDLAGIERLILRNCTTVLSQLGFVLDGESGATPITFDFAYNDEGKCVALTISQTSETPHALEERDKDWPFGLLEGQGLL